MKRFKEFVVKGQRRKGVQNLSTLITTKTPKNSHKHTWLNWKGSVNCTVCGVKKTSSVNEVAGYWGAYDLAAKYTIDTPGQKSHMKLLNRLLKAKRMKETE